MIRSFATRCWRTYVRRLKDRPLSTKTLVAAVIFFSSDSAAQFWRSHQHLRRHFIRTQEEAPSMPSSQPIMTENYIHSYSLHRALSAAIFGMIGSTWLHYWWNALESLVTVFATRLRASSSSWLASSRTQRLGSALFKVVIDQSLPAPLYTYTYYLVTNGIRFSLETTTSKVRNDDGSKRTSRSSSSRRRSRIPNAKTMIIDLDPHHDDPHERREGAHEKAWRMVWPTMLQHWKVRPVVHLANFYYVPLQHRVLVQNSGLVLWSGYLSYLNYDYELTTADDSR